MEHILFYLSVRMSLLCTGSVCVLSAHLASVVQTFQDEIKQFVATYLLVDKTYARPIHQDADKIYHCLFPLTSFSLYLRISLDPSLPPLSLFLTHTHSLSLSLLPYTLRE